MLQAYQLQWLSDSQAVTGTANVSITGLSAIGELGNETVWGLIIPDVGNTYTNITTGASQTWTEINYRSISNMDRCYTIRYKS